MSSVFLKSFLFSSLVVGVVACSSDPDGDGLSNKEEAAFGSDPKVADSDLDGLNDGEEFAAGLDAMLSDSDGDQISDGEEVEKGTNPLSQDSDADGYNDNDEIAKGSDPMDELSGIYEGGWPYQAHPENINDPTLNGAIARKGDVFANFTLKDIYGQDVSLYDYSQHGKSVILDISAEWCGPCQGIATWLSGDPSYADYDYFYPGVRGAINNGDLLYLTVLSDGPLDENGYGTAVTQKVIKDWDAAFPNENIAVLADKDQTVLAYSGLIYFPTLIILDENMVVTAVNRQSPMDLLDVAAVMVAEINAAK